MLVACWSAKGGSGLTVSTAGAALCAATSSDREVILIDLVGELPVALGLGPLPEHRGLAEWTRSAQGKVEPDALDQLACEVRPGVRLIPLGSGAIDADNGFRLLLDLIAVDDRLVLVDCGVLDVDDASMPRPDRAIVDAVLDRADQSLIVTRSCYLSLRRAARIAAVPTGVLLVTEPHRALLPADVADVLGAPVVARIAIDPAVARAVDAGLLAARLPRGFARALAPIAEFCHVR